jgi:hypothetical protein
VRGGISSSRKSLKDARFFCRDGDGGIPQTKSIDSRPGTRELDDVISPFDRLTIIIIPFWYGGHSVLPGTVDMRRVSH